MLVLSERSEALIRAGAQRPNISVGVGGRAIHAAVRAFGAGTGVQAA